MTTSSSEGKNGTAMAMNGGLKRRHFLGLTSRGFDAECWMGILTTMKGTPIAVSFPKKRNGSVGKIPIDKSGLWIQICQR